MSSAAETGLFNLPNKTPLDSAEVAELYTVFNQLEYQANKVAAENFTTKTT